MAWSGGFDTSSSSNEHYSLNNNSIAAPVTIGELALGTSNVV